jgi:hypothetical protein
MKNVFASADNVLLWYGGNHLPSQAAYNSEYLKPDNFGLYSLQLDMLYV